MGGRSDSVDERECANVASKGATPVDDFWSTKNSSPPYGEKREVPRYMFIATVDVAEPVSDTHFSGRISELSRKGCFVDLLNPLPVGTLIKLEISRDTGSFLSRGKIIYVQGGMGMGVAFIEPTADQLSVLDSWLAELSS
jgi:hypothetical protein